jgi:hypothetical protein
MLLESLNLFDGGPLGLCSRTRPNRIVTEAVYRREQNAAPSADRSRSRSRAISTAREPVNVALGSEESEQTLPVAALADQSVI